MPTLCYNLRGILRPQRKLRTKNYLSIYTTAPNVNQASHAVAWDVLHTLGHTLPFGRLYPRCSCSKWLIYMRKHHFRRFQVEIWHFWKLRFGTIFGGKFKILNCWKSNRPISSTLYRFYVIPTYYNRFPLRKQQFWTNRFETTFWREIQRKKRKKVD